MIARIWHGRTTVTRSDDYLAFLKQRAIPGQQKGCSFVAIAVFTMYTSLWQLLFSNM